MKRNEEKTRENNGSLRRQGKRMLAVLMSVLLLLGVMPQYVPAAAKGGQRSAETTAAIALTAPQDHDLEESIDYCTIEVSANSSLGGSVSGGGKYEKGTTVTVTATPHEGCTFGCWLENGRNVSNKMDYSFEAKNDRNLVAKFYVDENKPLIISDEAGLREFAELVNSDSRYLQLSAVLTADIVMSEKEWIPIAGKGLRSYRGVFDGNGHTITGLNYGKWDEIEYQCFSAFVGYLEGEGTVKNLTLKDCTIDISTDNGDISVGFIVGRNNGTIQNCHVTGSSSIRVVAGGGQKIPIVYAGGICGNNSSGSNNLSIIEYCSITGETEMVVKMGHERYEQCHLGGIAGNNYNGSTIRYCYRDTSGIIEGNGGKSVYVGGVVGSNTRGNVNNCYSIGDVKGAPQTYLYIGGVVGYASMGEIQDCFSIGGITSSGERITAGGAIGMSDAYTSISGCYFDRDKCPSSNSETDSKGLVGDEWLTLISDSGYSEDVWIQNNNIPVLKQFACNVTVHANDGTNKTKDILVDKYSYISRIGDAFAREGYTVNGWNTKADGSGIAYESTDYIEGDLELYIMWKPDLHTITFENEDGTELQSGKVAYGETPVYSGETPAKEATTQNTFTFAGWNTAIVAVTGDTTYTATYTQDVREYTVTFVNEDGTELQSGKVAYGETPKFKGETPTKGATAQYTYTFAGWDSEIAAVTGDATYTATFTPSVNEYTITFVNEDGKELQSGKVAYGETPAYNGKTPEKEATAQYTYTFAGWDKTITSVTGDTTYTATFTSTVNEYTVEFVNDDGTVLQTGKIAYGETPSYTGETPEKKADAQYTYTYAGWDKTIATVTGDETYTATYTSTVNEYTIEFMNEDGTVLQSGKVAYGETPSYNGKTPEKEATAQYSYTFNGWDQTIATVTGDATYTATYTSTVNEYTISFVNEDGTVLQSGKVAYGEAPKFKGETPSKEATAQYTYTFSGWDAEIVSVTGNATYTATFTSSVNEYTIIFVDEDGTELQSGKVAYGETPEFKGETPAKGATAQYTYTFSGWDAELATVTKDATYTATYDSTVNEYTITFVNSDGTELQSGKVPYGDLPEYTGETPMQPDSGQYTLIFAGWDTGIVPVTGEAKYTATFDTTVNEYTITFVNEDGTVLQSGKLAYGETPSYKGETPVKDKTAQYTYTFAGWDREIHSVVGDLTYTATFDAAVNEYKVTFQTNGGSEVAEVTAKYGDVLSAVNEPTKQGYDFDGWFTDEACTKAADLTAPITGDTTFYAKWEQVFYTATLNTSGWKEEDGTDFMVTVKRNRLDQKTFGAAKGFYMNGDPIDKENILTERGSLILTLKKEYLKTLPEGENELKIEFEDGSVTTKIKVTKKHDQPAAVKTGDTTPKGLWIALAIALVGMAATLLLGTPQKNTKTKIKPRRKVR